MQRTQYFVQFGFGPARPFFSAWRMGSAIYNTLCNVKRLQCICLPACLFSVYHISAEKSMGAAKITAQTPAELRLFTAAFYLFMSITYQILGRFHGIGANCIAALLGFAFCCSNIKIR